MTVASFLLLGSFRFAAARPAENQLGTSRAEGGVTAGITCWSNASDSALESMVAASTISPLAASTANPAAAPATTAAGTVITLTAEALRVAPLFCVSP